MATTTKKNKHTGKKILIGLLTVLVIAAGGFLYVYTRYLDYLKPGSANANEVHYVIPEGMAASEVIEDLVKEGFLQNELATKVYMKLNNIPGFFAGTFTLRKNMSTAEVLDVITNESNAVIEEIDITIIPGDWAKDAAARFAKLTPYTEEEFMNKWNDIEYIKTLIDKYEVLTEGILASEHCYLEGYLAPETYRIYANATIEEITERLLDHSEEIFQKYKEYIGNTGLNVHQLYTLASINQFEAKTAEDMRRVSAVFYNRLNEGWNLGSSVTICYALYDDYHTWEDCETNPNIASKYNTYANPGLPIGPVCNPGEDAIYAAINPVENCPYWYFMADVDTGILYFAKTYAEHEENIRKYLR